MGHVLKIKDSSGNWVGIPTISGESSYDIAVRHGFEGTEEEWVGDEYLRHRMDEVLSYAEEILPNIAGGIAILKNSEIDSIEKLNALLASGGRTFFYSKHSDWGDPPPYKHCPFEYGIVFSHWYDGYGYFDSPSYKQLAISLDDETCGQMFERYIVDNTDNVEGDNSYDLTQINWTPAGAYSREEIDNMIANHVNNMENPHGVTAGQIGTYTKDETLEQINSIANSAMGAVSQSLAWHESRADNPHKVTAQQVGAYSASEMDIALGMKANDYDLYTHKSNRSNPHAVTAEQVGAFTKDETNGVVNSAFINLERSTDEKLSKKADVEHTHREALAELKNIPLTKLFEDGVLTYVENASMPGETKITDNKISAYGAVITINYSGYVEFDISRTVTDLKIDGVAANTHSFKGYLEEGISFSVSLGDVTLNWYQRTFSGGFMSGEDKEKLDTLSESVGNIDTALDELHAYAQALISGGASE